MWAADLHGLPGPPPLDDPGKLTGWTRWMEVDSRRGCGSWCRRFLLLDDQQPQRQLIAVTAVEVDPENRYLNNRERKVHGKPQKHKQP